MGLLRCLPGSIKENQIAFVIALTLIVQGKAIAETGNQAQALKSFEQLVEQCRKSLPQTGAISVRYVQVASAWVTRKDLATSVTYDVRKTESLVSPLIGILRIEQKIATVRSDSEAAAMSASVDSAPVMHQSQVLRFDLRDGQWIVVDGTAESHVTPSRSASVTPTRVHLSRVDILRSPALQQCVTPPS